MTKSFFHIIRTSFDQTAYINNLSPYTNANDYVCSIPNSSTFTSTIKQIPNAKWGVIYFSLAEIQSNAASLAANGASFIGYDLEDEFSPPGDFTNIVSSVTSARDACHNEGLELAYLPGGTAVSLANVTATSSLIDIFVAQALLSQSSPMRFAHWTQGRLGALAAGGPPANIKKIVEVCTDPSNIDISSVLVIKNCYQAVIDIVDGVTLWSNKIPAGGDTVSFDFIRWFSRCSENR